MIQQITYIKTIYNCMRYMPVKTVKIATLLAGLRRFNNVHDSYLTYIPFYAQTSNRVHTLTCLPDLVIIGLLMITSSESSSIPRGGGTSHYDLYREAPPERGTFFRPQVYERVGISQAEVYERVGKCVI